ncbi:MAG: PepSY domain-containing protein [Clostridiales Family XIII bacterium]|nr:PepSY domain-containing protein [Clostridiales Family XIII bacterium]
MDKVAIGVGKRFVAMAAAFALALGGFAAMSVTDAYAASGDISLNKAKRVAVEDAGRKYGKVKFTKARVERDDGVEYYDIEFTYNTSKYRYEYDYEISMRGKVLEMDVDRHALQKGKFIGVKKAKNIALKKAGLKASQVTFTSAHRERDDGRDLYDIEFCHGDWEYSFEIAATTGRIIEWEKDYERGHAREHGHGNERGHGHGHD